MLTRSIFYHDAKLPVCKNVQMTVVHTDLDTQCIHA